METGKFSRAGFVLAGGKSSRMGSNKALLNLGGETLLSHALGTVRAVCGNAIILGDAGTFGGIGPTIEDVLPNCGPLGGIHAALHHSTAELNLMLAVDLPFVTSGLLELLMDLAAKSAAVVTAPRTRRGFQPLCAIYRRTFLEVAERNLRAGKYKIDTAFAGLPLRIVEENELTAAGFSERNFFNVNTPEEYGEAERAHS